MIYKGTELTCTQEELDAFVEGITIVSEVRGFDQKYNNVVIDNPTGAEDAKYYTLKINGSTFLQNHSPFEQGFVAITDENAQGIIDAHKQSIIDSIVIERFKVSPADETEQLKNQVALMQTALDDLILGGAL